MSESHKMDFLIRLSRQTTMSVLLPQQLVSMIPASTVVPPFFTQNFCPQQLRNVQYSPLMTSLASDIMLKMTPYGAIFRGLDIGRNQHGYSPFTAHPQSGTGLYASSSKQLLLFDSLAEQRLWKHDIKVFECFCPLCSLTIHRILCGLFLTCPLLPPRSLESFSILWDPGLHTQL